MQMLVVTMEPSMSLSTGYNAVRSAMVYFMTNGAALWMIPGSVNCSMSLSTGYNAVRSAMVYFMTNGAALWMIPGSVNCSIHLSRKDTKCPTVCFFIPMLFKVSSGQMMLPFIGKRQMAIWCILE
jgi:hypothetical protein